MQRSASTSVLITGFEPFGGETVNPSWQAVQAVHSAWTGPEQLHAVELPVDFARLDAALTTAIDRHAPNVVICFGQAGGATGIQVERIAINVDDARIPDNSGFQPIDEAIVQGGPAAYFSSLPIKATVAALGAAGLPAKVSQTAGTYTCNHAFYRLMHELENGPADRRGGFVHVPFSAEQAAGTDRPFLTIEQITAAVLTVVEAVLSTGVDLKVGGGSLD